MIWSIFDKLTKKIEYELVKTMIDKTSQTKIFIDVIIKPNDIIDFIISNPNALFTSKLSLFLYYFQGIKQKLFTIFYPKMNS